MSHLRHYRGSRGFETRYCPRCRTQREFGKRFCNHRLHLIFTVVTFGLWGIPWLLDAIAEMRRPWRCSTCRSCFGSSTGRFDPIAHPGARHSD